MYGSKNAAVPEPIDPSAKSLMPPIRIQSSPKPVVMPAATSPSIGWFWMDVMRTGRSPSARSAW